MADQAKRGTFIHGIAASEHLDSSGERIQIEGVDITSLTKDGVFNYEHNSKEASSIVGKILEAKKILKRSDCDNDNQKYFWDKIKMPYLYVAGELFDAVGHKEAGEVAAMVRYDQQEPVNKDTKKLINFSIEGSRMEKQGAIITKCIARKISITLTPCNKVCEAEELKADPKEEKHSDSGKFAFIQDIMDKSDEPSCQIMKGEIPFLYKAAPAMIAPKMSIAPIAPKKPAAPKMPKTNIARPDKGFGTIVDKTPKPAKPNYGKVIVKGKKTPVTMTAEEAVDEHEKLVDVLESPSHKDDKQEAKKQNKELKEYKEKLNKSVSVIKPVHPKDPILNPSKFAPKAPSEKKQKQYAQRVTQMQQKKMGKKEDKGVLKKPYESDAQRRWAHTSSGTEALGGKEAVAHWDKESKGKDLPERKKKLSKYDSNVRKALTASCGLGSSPATKVQGDAVAKAELYIVRKDNDIQKASKNVREQRAKVFGTKSQPGAKSSMREKHLQHIKKFVDKFLGLDLNPSGGKVNEKTGERRDENPEIGVDKPDWRSGQLETQWNPEAAVHEIAHLMLLPKGVSLENGQRLMDKQYADVQKQYGYLKQKRSQGEVQPMAAEQLIRRFLGLPASQVSVPAESKDAPPRVAVEDPKQVIATRIKQGKTKEGDDKYVDLIRQARNLTPEHKQRLEDVFARKIKFDPDRGWIPNKQSLEAAITTRKPGAVIARQEKRKAQELPSNVIRMKQSIPKPIAPQVAPQDSQDQVNPPEMAQAPKPRFAKSENEKTGDVDTNSSHRAVDEGKERSSRGGTSPQGEKVRQAAIHPATEKWLDTHHNPGPTRRKIQTNKKKATLAARGIARQRLKNLKRQPKPNLTRAEMQKAMKIIGDQAFERFEKKEELLKFLEMKLPSLSSKERLAIAKAVAYTREKKKELILKTLIEEDNG